MADQPTDKAEAAAPAAAPASPAAESLSTDAKPNESELAKKQDDDAQAANEGAKDDADAEAPAKTETADKDATENAEQAEKKPTDDVEMKDAPEADAAEDESAAADTSVVETPASKNKARRKSSAGETKAKTLSKKGSKARLTHIDAQPGDHFLVKLKGHPAWPAIVCDESMLPQALISTRPVTAAKPDGTYQEAYADGGKRVNDRTFPVMYLHTNEFGWTSNTAFSVLTPEKAKDTITEKMRKDLKSAFELAAEHHPLDYYKDILQKFEEELAASVAAEAAAAATPKKSKKGKSKADDEDDMDIDDIDEGAKSAKSKKRKAEEDVATPQRPESVKKPKIKLNTSSTPKTANGAGTPKAKTESAVKSKTKPKKGKEGKEGADKKAEAVKEGKMTPEERQKRKEKEVLYLRHKLQRGLLTRDQQPQETEMKQMSDFVAMLENFTDLEVSIIRTTKINKVLKAILKLDSIPREDEFHFKDRSQALLDKWNKLMAGDAAPGAPAASNGVNGTAESHADDKASETNGVKDAAEGSKDDVEMADAKAESADADAEKENSASEEAKTADDVTEGTEEEKEKEEPVSKAPAAPESVEAAA